MLIDFIPKGRENAMTGKELSQMLDRPNRQIRFEIERLRRDGVVICSSSRGQNKGYYIPENEQEKEEFLAQYESYIKQMRRTLYEMRNY
jgi:biotin operon repressor